MKARAETVKTPGSDFRKTMFQYQLDLLYDAVIVEDMQFQRMALAVDLLFPHEKLLWDGFDTEKSKRSSRNSS
jgi:hypothetical protein